MKWEGDVPRRSVLRRAEAASHLTSMAVVSLVGLLFLAVATLLLLSYVQIINWPPRPTLATLLIFICLSLAVFLAAIWYLAVAKVILLEINAQRLIGRVLVGALLGAVAVGAAQVFKEVPASTQSTTQK